MKNKQMIIVGVAVMMALLIGCVSDDRAGSEDLDRFVEICREIAMTPVEQENPEDPMTEVDWMVYPCSDTTQEFKKDYKVVYADSAYMSFRAEEYSYLGGAHGSTRITVGTIDRKTGRILRLCDFVPASKLSVIEKLLYDRVVKAIGGKDHLLDEVKPIENFYLAEDGLHFVYNQYVVACYADGWIEVVIKLEELK